MVNIIKADLYRILRGKAIYISLIMVILMLMVSIVSMSPGHIGITTNSNTVFEDSEMLAKISEAKSLTDIRNIMKEGGDFQLDKDIIGTNANLYYVFIIVVSIVLVTDFSNKTIKNSLSSAISRKKYYLSKLILIFGLCTFLVIFNNYTCYILNILINDHKFSASLSEITKLSLIQLPLIYGIISLLICFAFIFRKASRFNSVSIPFIMVLQIVVIGLTNLFKWKLDWFYDYEFQFALGKLASNPANNYIVKCIGLGIIYILLFNIIGYYTFKKTEIK